MENVRQLGIRVGDMIIHKDCNFVIVDIRCDESMEGTVLHIRAFDPSMADTEQQRKIKVDQTSNNFLDMFKKLSEGGKEGGVNLGGFNIGNM
jgi:hypothetical protein